MTERNTTEEGCGRIIGHGEFCSKGWLCGECKVKAELKEMKKTLKEMFQAHNEYGCGYYNYTPWNVAYDKLATMIGFEYD